MSTEMIDDDMKAMFEGVVGVVEATSYESMCLWQRYHKEKGMPWIEARSGRSPTVGECGGFPVVVSMFAHTVDGHKLLFIDPTSRVVDHTMIEDWLKKHLPLSARQSGDNSEYLNKVNAMNFGNVLPR